MVLPGVPLGGRARAYAAYPYAKLPGTPSHPTLLLYGTAVLHGTGGACCSVAAPGTDPGRYVVPGKVGCRRGKALGVRGPTVARHSASERVWPTP
eukprot:2800693-Rhodomonas_salina.3